MARKVLQIIASEAARRTLGALGSPLIQVTVRGHVTSGSNCNTLTIERVCTCKSMTLPIIASQAACATLGEIAKSKASHEVALQGRVVQGAFGNCLILDQVGKAARLPIIADASMRKILAGMASEKGGEITVRARVVEQAGNKVLVLGR
jgi:hypothetical protein